jgi:hypothetical protein
VLGKARPLHKEFGQGYLVLVSVEVVLGNFGIGITGVLRCLVQVTFCIFLLCIFYRFSQSFVCNVM